MLRRGLLCSITGVFGGCVAPLNHGQSQRLLIKSGDEYIVDYGRRIGDQDAVGFDVEIPYRVYLGNNDDKSHRLTVSLQRDGEHVLSQPLELGAQFHDQTTMFVVKLYFPGEYELLVDYRGRQATRTFSVSEEYLKTEPRRAKTAGGLIKEDDSLSL